MISVIRKELEKMSLACIIKNGNKVDMNAKENNFRLIDTTSNPAPLGLLGFGITTVLLNLHNAGFFAIGSMILAMGIFYGGIAQVIAGIMEWKKNNTFGATAFTSYGLFWLSLVALLVLPKMGLAEAAGATAMGFYLLMWGIFTGLMFIATLKLTKELQFVFGSLTILFFLLAIGDFTGIAWIKTLAGYEGIICGGSAIYTAFVQIYGEVFKKAEPVVENKKEREKIDMLKKELISEN